MLRLDAAHDSASEREMFAYLDSQYPTLEEYHAELLRRLEAYFPDSTVRQRFPFNAAGGANDMQSRYNELWRSLKQEQQGHNE